MKRTTVPTLCCVAVLLVGCGGSAKYAESAPGGYAQMTRAPAPAADRSYDYYAEETGVVTASESDSGGLFEGVFGDSDDYDKGPYEVAQAEPAPAPDPKAPTPEAPDEQQPPETVAKKARVILYSATMQLFVLEMDISLEKATRLCDEVGGWVQGSTSNSLTLRIPAEHFRQYLAWMRELGDVADENIVGQDVTEEFYDLEIRLRNAMEMRDRYVELLAKASTVKEILAIEAELGRITAEIESMKGRLRFLSEHARYSTVTVYFQQASSTYSAQQHVALPFGWLRSYNINTLYKHSDYYY